MNRISTLLVGGSGIALTEATPTVASAVGGNVPDLIQVVIQLAIGIVTLLGLLKKKK